MIPAALLLAALLAAPDTSGTVTLPLHELIPLLEQGKKPEKARPPVNALLVSAQLKGRLGAEALNIDAHFEVEVLADGEWIIVPLMPVGPEVSVSSRLKGEAATIATLDNQLVLVTRKAGSYAVNLALTVRARATGQRREATLPISASGPHPILKLEIDPAFELLEPRTSDATVDLFAQGDSFHLAWRALAAKAPVRKAVERPPLEPAIPRATATWVSTLEGKLELRVRYSLQLDRPQPLELALPEGMRLKRVALNGRPLAAAPAAGVLRLEVAPGDTGSSESTLEVVLVEELGVFHLSGAFTLTLPRASWPIGEVVARAWLPKVFEYRREGGSLEALGDDESEENARQLPGKKLAFRQYRVSTSAPAVELSYSVDIEKSYFR